MEGWQVKITLTIDVEGLAPAEISGGALHRHLENFFQTGKVRSGPSLKKDGSPRKAYTMSPAERARRTEILLRSHAQRLPTKEHE
jgi:hypothetical protein